jgi:hypothetical protein
MKKEAHQGLCLIHSVSFMTNLNPPALGNTN